MKIVVAIGGNALARRGEAISAANLQKNVKEAMMQIAPLAIEHEVVITHGNGPQVGLLALQNLAYEAVPAYPLDILVAQTQGILGYVIETEIINCLKNQKPVASVLTTTVVSAQDPAFDHPTKFVGPVYVQEQAEELARKYGWEIAMDGKWWRRVVASPQPLEVKQSQTVKQILDSGSVVICVGGGGVPVFLDDTNGKIIGAEAVVDKDLASAVLAKNIDADMLLLLTDADGVYTDWGTATARCLREISADDLANFGFADGSMGPKVKAASQFVANAPGKVAVVGAIEKIPEIIAKESGTHITSDAQINYY